MNSFTLQAPAKLNLSLRILGKRDDGFHEIDTLMVKIQSLTDEIEFQEAKKFSFVCDDFSVPSDERNLVVKAVRAYENAAKVECKWAISLKKRIPHGAGLGGGSSDAAATLLGMNRIYDSKLSEESLGTLGASLGSDVSFFLMDGPARCVGRGEKILPAPPISPLRVLLLKPCFEVATPDAYQRWESSLEIPGISYAPQNFAGINLINDLERPVFGKHVLKNTGVTVATVTGIQVSVLLGGSVVIEQVFGLPGIGGLVLEAVIARDLPVVQGIVLVTTLMVLATSLLVEMSYGYFNPRVRG